MKYTQIKRRIAVSFSIFMILTLVLMGFVIASLYSREMLKGIRLVTNQNLQIINNDLEDQLDNVYKLFETLQDQEELQRLLLLKIESETENYERMRQVSTIVREYAYADIGITSIFMFDTNGQVLDPLYLLSPYKDIIDQYDEYWTYKESELHSKFSKPSNFPSKLEKEHGEKMSLTYFEKYLSKEDFKPLGTVLITLKMDYLFQDFKSACKSKFDSVFIVDETGNVILQTGGTLSYNEFSPKLMFSSEDNGIININKKSYYFNIRKLDNYPSWKVVGVIEYGKIREDMNVILRIILIFSFAGIVLLIVFSFLLANKITDPILKLRNAMDGVSKGEWPEPLVPETEDELKDLIEGFNDMVSEQQKLIEQIYDEQEKKKEIEVQTVQLRLDLLQSQINPHFIHNTLNAIQFLIKTGRSNDAEEMLRSFNILLRSSMSQSKDFITIREELECIRSFAQIQKVRYDDIFEMNYDVEESLENMIIPKLILQPIVENAIYHGIAPKGEAGCISISMKVVNDMIHISVIDDGVGMDSKEIESLIDGSEVSRGSSFNRISFRNINNRLLLAYGNEEGLNIKSSIGCGTTVSFQIPIYEDVI